MNGTGEAGSSPRGRGKRRRLQVRRAGRRHIPAWAGKTTAPGLARAHGRAHPRVGGENGGLRVGGLVGPGSSPRGRGKLRHGRRLGARDRLIPAWAGKTPSSRPRSTERRAHPRVGGENDLFLVSKEDTPGSSPRGRGKPSPRLAASSSTGLIPAWAGKTGTGATLHRAFPAHPRVGGENH